MENDYIVVNALFTESICIYSTFIKSPYFERVAARRRDSNRVEKNCMNIFFILST